MIKMEKCSIWETPQNIQNINDCYFYHTINLPDYGVINGSWDLRANIDNYLGNVNFNGKRVLDVGTASGFLCFEMEKRGAEVVAFDLSLDEAWDHVPFCTKAGVYTQEVQDFIAQRIPHIQQLHNSFWFCHRVLNSKANVCYGNAYEIPREIGDVDISLLGCILLHMRNPLAAIESAAKLTRKTIIITEPAFLDIDYNLPAMTLHPNLDNPNCLESWWQLTPRLVGNFLQILGFSEISVTNHIQIGINQQPYRLFTVVGNRVG